MKKILFILSAAAVAGCNTTTFERTSPDGSVIKVANRRAIWTTESYVCQISATNASLTATKSNPDAQTVAALAELLKTAKP